MIKCLSAKLNLFLRFVAAGTLVAWLMAVSFCSTECLGEDSHSGPAHMDQTAATGSQSHDSVCVSLHSICPTSPNSVLARPDFGLAFTLNFISTPQLVTLAQSETCRPYSPRIKGATIRGFRCRGTHSEHSQKGNEWSLIGIRCRVGNSAGHIARDGG